VEKSGVLNLGVEGMMVVGAIAGFAAKIASGSYVTGFVAAMLAGAVMALIFGLLTQILLSNQVATGLALTLFGLGISALIGQGYSGQSAGQFPRLDSFGIGHIPGLGKIAAGLDIVAIGVFKQHTCRPYLAGGRGKPRCGACRRPRGGCGPDGSLDLWWRHGRPRRRVSFSGANPVLG
jgi:Branched-chain amino acid transport system / permease component